LPHHPADVLPLEALVLGRLLCSTEGAWTKRRKTL
jgi:hypothetical protein